ncbi:acyl carrier protein [Heyndrickxia sp. NPDC080065]|uniref:acyl carrier protein n=1 Tax=Heyndrickxia sp. NPDC080065 TaxID=3390568 RepID=UPI003D0519BD
MFSEKDLEIMVKKIIIDTLKLNNNLEEIPSNESLKDSIGLDSLDMIEIQLVLQEEFNIDITDEDLSTMTTIENICSYILGKNNMLVK